MSHVIQINITCNYMSMRSRHRKVRGGWHDQVYRPSQKQKLYDSMNYFRSRGASKEWEDMETELSLESEAMAEDTEVARKRCNFWQKFHHETKCADTCLEVERICVLISASRPQNWMPTNVLSHSVKRVLILGKAQKRR